MSVHSVIDARSPKLGIIWEKAQELPVYELPADAQVFARERWTGAPLDGGLTPRRGAVLWVAATPGERGYERFPYVLAGPDRPRSAAATAIEPAVGILRFVLPNRVSIVDYFAARWRKAGIAALHVAAWHYNEPDPERDAYLRRS